MGAQGQRRGALIDGINVTPLVDVTLVLLVIFIVTARIVTPALPLDLPRATQGEVLQTIFAVSVLPSGELVLDGQPIADATLRSRASHASLRDPDLRAVIQADKRVSHGRVLEVLDSLRAAGITRVAFGTAAAQPEPTRAAAPVP
jgi:biopolymer transport protein TolR